MHCKFTYDINEMVMKLASDGNFHDKFGLKLLNVGSLLQISLFENQMIDV
jgi:hypothetical protein